MTTSRPAVAISNRAAIAGSIAPVIDSKPRAVEGAKRHLGAGQNDGPAPVGDRTTVPGDDRKHRSALLVTWL